MKARIGVLIAGLAWSFAGLAAESPQILRAKVTGSIQVNADGSVRDVELNDSLGRGISAALARRMKQWRFTPREEGAPATNGSVILSLEASEWKESTEIRVVQATFRGLDTSTDTVRVTEGTRSQVALKPAYPSSMSKASLGGILSVIVTVDNEGRVAATAVDDAVVVDYRGSRKNREERYRQAVQAMYASAKEALKEYRVGDADLPGESSERRVLKLRVPFQFQLADTVDRGWVPVSRVLDVPDPWDRADTVAPQTPDNILGSTRLLTDISQEPAL